MSPRIHAAGLTVSPTEDPAEPTHPGVTPEPAASPEAPKEAPTPSPRRIAEQTRQATRRRVASDNLVQQMRSAIEQRLAFGLGSGESARGYGPGLVARVDGQVRIAGTEKNDDIRIRRFDDTHLSVTINGHETRVEHRPGESIAISGLDGDDRVEVDPTLETGVLLDGGAGHDVLLGGAGDDQIAGGSGEDLVDGRGGDDMLSGGADRDTLYGLDGDDVIDGGGDVDYVDGGAGDDTITGGGGDDALVGGRGADTYVDAVEGERLEIDDLAAGEDDVGHNVQIDGSDEFIARIQSDLDALRATPEGRALLADLDGSGQTVTIRETDGGPNARREYENGALGLIWRRTAGRVLDGNFDDDTTPANIEMNTGFHRLPDEALDGRPRADWMTMAPVVALYHELTHALHQATGTVTPGSTEGIRNEELATVGLTEGSGPHTENGLRDRLHQPTRTYYR